VFERVFEETRYTGRWAIDHAETIKPANIARIKAMAESRSRTDSRSPASSSPSVTASRP
jgi:hypothetical protein